MRYRLHAPGDAAPIDEIEEFWNARYLSSGEAAWRTVGFNITLKDPAVTALPIHLPTSTAHRHYNRRNHNPDSVSLLDRYFICPTGQFLLHDNMQDFNRLTYTDYYTLFRLEKATVRVRPRANHFAESRQQEPPQCVILRDPAHRHLARIRPVRPTEGDTFYLRAILQHTPLRSFEDGLCVEGVQYDSFQDAACHMGLFADQNEAQYAMHEAIHDLRMPKQMRLLFVHLLINECIPTPIHFWDCFHHDLALDFTL